MIEKFLLKPAISKCKYYLFCLVLLPGIWVSGQSGNKTDALKLPLNENGSHYFQVTFLNQVWLRYNQNNPGTLVEGKPRNDIFDIGLRRTRIQMFGQITDKVFVYFQFGQNNFNAQFNSNSNRKLAAFFHDALCEYKVSNGNELKLGGGLTIANGPSRFSQPSIGSIMTTDVPVFAQTTVDQTDEFSRKLSVFARGQVGKFDYRFILSDPFPITSSGQAPLPIGEDAQFSQLGHTLQTQGYLMYQFFDHEQHVTPYMAGTYLGKKKIWNIAAGFVHQKDAMWRKTGVSDTTYQAMNHFALESFLDMPLDKEKGTSLSAFLGYFNTNYGTNYLRYNGIMNPANGTSLNGSNSITGHGPTYGNAYPMFGTGQTVYAQAGYLLPKGKNEHNPRWMPYASASFSKFDRLQNQSSNIFNAGMNCLLKGHQAKFSLDWQNRPTFEVLNNNILKGDRKNTITFQYQIFF